MHTNLLTANIGLFYACYRLSLLGWNALPTIRNAKGPDIILVNDQKKLGIQVKTLSGETDVPMGTNYDDPSVDFWIVLMNIRGYAGPRAFIISQENIMQGVAVCKQGINSAENLIYHDTPKEDGSIRYWINKGFLVKGKYNYSEAWESIK